VQTNTVSFDMLNLPNNIIDKFHGYNAEIIQLKDGILLKKISKKDINTDIKGIMKNYKFNTKKYLENKEQDKNKEL